MPLLLSLSPALAATLVVGPSDYRSIADAVDDADPGDTIEVTPGTYDETVTVEIDLTIVGTGGSGSTTWGSGFASDSLDVEGGATVTVQGFTFEPDGRAIDLTSGAVTGIDLVVRNNQVFDRPGTAFRARPGTTLIIEDSELVANETVFWAGGHVFAEDAVVQLRRTLLADGTGSDGGCLWAADSEVLLEDVTIEGCEGTLGAGVFLDGGSLVATDTVFTDNRVRTGFGVDPDAGGLYAIDATVTLTDVTFSGNAGGVTGGGLRLEEATAVLTRASITDNEADYGGGIYVDGGSLTLVDSYLARNEATEAGGGIRWRHEQGRLDISGSQFDDNDAGISGGGIGTTPRGLAGGDLLIDATRFDRNTAGQVGGALELIDQIWITVATSRLCHNEAPTGAGAAISGGEGGVWLNNNFIGNLGGTFGGALHVASAPDQLIGANDFLANVAVEGSAMYATDSSVVFVNNLVAYHQGTAVSAVATTGSLTYSLFHDNTPADLSPNLAKIAGPGIVYGDPMLTAFSHDGNCDNDDLTPQAGSPLIDAGDPNLVDDDGSPSDIGSVGGGATEPGEDADGDGVATPDDCDDTDASVYPGAVEDCTDVDRDCSGDPYDAEGSTLYYADGDGDGFGNVLEPIESCEPVDGYVRDATDCRDDDPSTFPGATEVCNGYDDDCDNQVDEGLSSSWWPDADADGWGAGAAVEACDAPEGYADRDGDCDDGDAAIHPEASDTDGDGVDSDCDGSDGPDGGPATVQPEEGVKAKGSCGCSTPGPAHLGWLALVPLIWRRRR